MVWKFSVEVPSRFMMLLISAKNISTYFMGLALDALFFKMCKIIKIQQVNVVVNLRTSSHLHKSHKSQKY